MINDRVTPAVRIIFTKNGKGKNKPIGLRVIHPKRPMTVFNFIECEGSIRFDSAFQKISRPITGKPKVIKVSDQWIKLVSLIAEKAWREVTRT